ncbi:prepilin-type N-terminal cleavage/methylation domain-containing protein, partial [bacterium]|nr:prepilin-type N-terminal cleavage/methylation domain-containing protein [bacterium]
MGWRAAPGPRALRQGRQAPRDGSREGRAGPNRVSHFLWRRHPVSVHHTPRRAFTLVELLVVIAVML